MLTALAIRNIVIFLHLLKVHQISSNLQNLLESASETCMWNLSPFKEVKFFMQKCQQRLSQLLKVYQISSNLQNLLQSASETCMWNLSPFREIKNFHAKLLTALALQIIMKLSHLFKVHQISSNLHNLLKSASKTFMWNLSSFREVKIFHAKMPFEL